MTITQLRDIIVQMKGSVDDDMNGREIDDNKGFLLGKSVAYLIVLQLIEAGRANEQNETESAA